MFSSKCLTPPFIFSPPIGHWRVLVPEVAVVQGSPPHYVSPLTHDKPIQESFHSDRGEEYVNEHAAQDDKKLVMEQLFERNLRLASSTPRYNSHPGPMIGPTIVGASLSFQLDFDPSPPSPKAPYTSPLQRLTIMTCYRMAKMLRYSGLVLLICKGALNLLTDALRN